MRNSFVFAAVACCVLATQASCAQDSVSGETDDASGATGSGGNEESSSTGLVTSSTSGNGGSSSSTGGGGSPATTSTGVGAGGGSGSSTSSGAGAGGSGQAPGMFEAPNPWTKVVANSPKSASSDAITQWLASHGGWGTGTMRIDFSINVLDADGATPFKTFNPTDDFYAPDCDHIPFPVPSGGAIEGENGYQCTSDGDCHLIVLHGSQKKLYEMWRADISGGVFNGGCAAVWDLTKSYPDNLRGEGCTSADAGGFPIAPMLFTPDEVAAGEIAHAIRFILPNNRIRDNVYVHPGSHSTGATSGGANAPPYGVRFRLRADFPLDSLPSDGARVVAKALQKYGMFLADAGNIALTASSDQFTQHSWDEVGVDSYALAAIQPTDMEVVEMGSPITWSGDCERNQ